jgi:hypothetical protein
VADVKPARRSVPPKVGITKSQFVEENEESYTAELKLDTPDVIHGKLPDKTTIMLLIDM